MEIEYTIRNDKTNGLIFVTVQGDEEDIEVLCEHLEGQTVVKKNIRPQHMVKVKGVDEWMNSD